MKKIFLTTFLFVSMTKVQSQDFSFKLYFEDAVGNKDTVTLGYDATANKGYDLNFGEGPTSTAGIDERFGEENIITQPFKDLDVRFTNEWEMRFLQGREGNFHTKKQISNYSCLNGGTSSLQSMDIFTKHWPVTMSWETSLFEDSCRNGSFITSASPGGWWDVGGQLQFLGKDGSVAFTSDNGNSEMYQYVKGNDTVFYFWQLFNDSSMFLSLKSKVKVDNRLNVFPNPAADKVYLNTPQQFGKIALVDLYSSLLQSVQTAKNIEEIDLSNLNKGLYFIKVENENGDQLMNRFLKE